MEYGAKSVHFNLGKNGQSRVYGGSKKYSKEMRMILDVSNTLES